VFNGPGAVNHWQITGCCDTVVFDSKRCTLGGGLSVRFNAIKIEQGRAPGTGTTHCKAVGNNAAVTVQ